LARWPPCARPDFQLFSLKDDPDGLWVAEDDGEIRRPRSSRPQNR
jgi:hypothetical protein